MAMPSEGPSVDRMGSLRSEVGEFFLLLLEVPSPAVCTRVSHSGAPVFQGWTLALTGRGPRLCPCSVIFPECPRPKDLPDSII